MRGHVYRITGTYEMPYGLGCTLLGLNPWPYAGYFLHRRGKGTMSGWYFEPLKEADDEEFLALMRRVRQSS